MQSFDSTETYAHRMSKGLVRNWEKLNEKIDLRVIGSKDVSVKWKYGNTVDCKVNFKHYASRFKRLRTVLY